MVRAFERGQKIAPNVGEARFAKIGQRLHAIETRVPGCEDFGECWTAESELRVGQREYLGDLESRRREVALASARSEVVASERE